MQAPTGRIYRCDPESTYVQEPPYFEGLKPEPESPRDVSSRRDRTASGRLSSATSSKVSQARCSRRPPSCCPAAGDPGRAAAPAILTGTRRPRLRARPDPSGREHGALVYFWIANSVGLDLIAVPPPARAERRRLPAPRPSPPPHRRCSPCALLSGRTKPAWAGELNLQTRLKVKQG
jgi:hypothetical protein